MEAFNLIIVEVKSIPQVQSLSKFANKNIVAYFINIRTMTTDQLDMKLHAFDTPSLTHLESILLAFLLNC